MSEQELSKMGQATVTMTEVSGEPCISKRNASAIEIGFYRYAAPALLGVHTPKVVSIAGDELCIEFIPNSMSLQQLQSDTRTFEQLAAIHGSNYQPNFEVKRHQWTPEETEQALQALTLPETTQASIRHIQTLAHPLFECSTLISGDTNDGNWGTRHNGDLVLFDWERFGFGSPAIDLAPLVYQMGNMADYESVVAQYSRHNTRVSEAALLKQLIIAKCWIVVEVSNLLVQRNKPEAAMYLDWFNQKLPSWLDKIEKEL